MKTTQTQRQEQYQAATPVQQYWYGAMETARMIGNTSQQHDLNESQHDALVIGVGEVILDFLEPSELAAVLEEAGIAADTAVAISDDLAPLFEKLNEPLPPEAYPEEEETESEVEQHLPVSEPVVQNQTVPASTLEGYDAASAPQAAPAPTIAGLRQRAVATWGQYLSTVVGKDKEGLKASVADLAHQAKTLQQQNTVVTPESDPSAYWHELKTRIRANAPHIDEAALERIRTAYATPAVAGEAGGIIKAIKDSAGA